jgi:hypothetical protein
VVEGVPERPAIAAAPQVVINIFGMPSPEQDAIIRQALPGHGRDGRIPDDPDCERFRSPNRGSW